MKKINFNFSLFVDIGKKVITLKKKRLLSHFPERVLYKITNLRVSAASKGRIKFHRSLFFLQVFVR